MFRASADEGVRRLGLSAVFSWITAFVGLTVRNPEVAQSTCFIWVFPLVFASPALVPTAHMPGVVRTFADINPVTLAVNAARALTIGHGDAPAPALETLAWIGVLLLVFVSAGRTWMDDQPKVSPAR